MTTRFLVIDRNSGPKSWSIVGDHSTRKRARRAADKLDLAYGAIRYAVVIVNVREGYSRADLYSALAQTTGVTS